MTSPRINFVNDMIVKQKKIKTEAPQKVNAELANIFVREFVKYFQGKYDTAINEGKTRKHTALSSAQTSISRFKRDLSDQGEDKKEFLNALKLTRDENMKVKNDRKQVVFSKAIDIPSINGDAVVEDCIKFLKRDEPHLKLIALACLTGRRMAELLLTASFEPPTETHATNIKYWTRASGFVKQRTDGEPVRTREIPLLAPREDINKALDEVRSQLPTTTVREVNSRYAKGVQRAMKKFCPNIQRIHQFRKLYVLICFHYFNERHCSLPRLAAEYLAHKTMDTTVLTYLNFRVDELGKLDFKK